MSDTNTVSPYIEYMSSQIYYDGETHTDVFTGYSNSDYGYYTYNKNPKKMYMFTNAFFNYPDLTSKEYDENGLHITINKTSHSIRVLGTATSDTTIVIGKPRMTYYHKYQVSGCPNDGGSKTTFYFSYGKWNSYTTDIIHYGIDYKFNYDDYFKIVIKKGTQMKAYLDSFVPEVNDTVCIDSGCDGLIWKKWNTDLSGNSFTTIFPNEYFYERVTISEGMQGKWGSQSQAYVVSDVAYQDVDGIVCEKKYVSNTYNMPLVCCANNKYGVVIVHEENDTGSKYGFWRYNRLMYSCLKNGDTDEYYWKRILYMGNGSDSHWCDGSIVPSANNGFLIPKVDSSVTVHNITYSESTGVNDTIIFSGSNNGVTKSYTEGNNVSFVKDLSINIPSKRYVIMDGYWGKCYYPITLVGSSNVYIDFNYEHSGDMIGQPFTDCALIPKNGFNSSYNIYKDGYPDPSPSYNPKNTDTVEYDPRYLKVCKEIFDIAYPKHTLQRPNSNYNLYWSCSHLQSLIPVIVDGKVQITSTYKCTTSCYGGGSSASGKEVYVVNILLTIDGTNITVTECEGGLPDQYKSYKESDITIKNYYEASYYTQPYEYNNKLYYYQYAQKSYDGKTFTTTNNCKLYSTTDNVNFKLEKNFGNDISFNCVNRYFKFSTKKDSSYYTGLNKCSSVKIDLYKERDEYTSTESRFFKDYNMIKDINVTSLNLSLFDFTKAIIDETTKINSVSNKIYGQDYMLKLVGDMPSINSNSEFILKLKLEYTDVDINEKSSSDYVSAYTYYAYLVFDSPLLNNLRGFHISNGYID